MLDMKFIRENRERVEKALKNRGEKIPLNEILKLDEKRRKILSEVEALKHEKNRASEEISGLKNEGDRKILIKKMQELK